MLMIEAKQEKEKIKTDQCCVADIDLDDICSCTEAKDRAETGHE